jgi:hypothetical protein
MTAHALLATCIGQPISASQPDEITGPRGVSLKRAADGRLNGYNFSLNVLGYADAPCSGSMGYSAPPGDSVAIVSYNLAFFGYYGGYYAPVVSFVVNGKRIPAVGVGDVGGTDALALAVPNKASVDFAVTEVGLTQELAFSTGARVAPSPPVLYRSAKAPALTKTFDKTVQLSVVDPHDGLKEPDDITLDTVTLTYFSPVDPNAQPASVNGAFLVINASEAQPHATTPVDWSRAMPADRMRLVLPDGKTIEPDPASRANASVFDLLNGTYFFDVPASFTTARLEIAPGTNPAQEGGPLARKTQDTVVGTADFAIVLPPAPVIAPSKPVKASTGTTRPATTKRAATTPHTKQGGSIVIGIVTVVLALVVVVLVRVLVRRRRRRAGPYAVNAAGERVQPLEVLAPVPLPVVIPGRSDEAQADKGLLARPEAVAVAPPGGVAGSPEGAVPAIEPATDSETAPTPASETPAAPKTGLLAGVLGPVEVAGLEMPTNRRIVIELLCLLACNRERAFTSSEMRSELFPLGDDGRERANKETFRTYVSRARRAAGKANFPQAHAASFRLGPNVSTDWDQFKEVVARAHESDPSTARELLAAALDLIRGPLFAGVPEGRFAWAYNSGLVSEMEVAIIGAASELAENCLAAEEPAVGLAGLGKALVATKDHGVADDLLTAAGATGNLATLERAWRDVIGVLNEDAVTLQRSYEAIRNRIREADGLAG